MMAVTMKNMNFIVSIIGIYYSLFCKVIRRTFPR
jgi:hypothetical protein